MNFLHRLTAVLTVSLKRLWAQKGLTLATLVGLMAGVAMTMAVPLYADAVNFRVLQEELSRSADRVRKPPFAFMYDYIGAWAGPIDWQATRALDDYLRGPGATRLGLPVAVFTSHFETDAFRLYPAGGAYTDEALLGYATLATAENLAGHITLTGGAFPQPSTDPAVPVEVLVSEARAAELGLQVGDGLIALNPNEAAAERELPVRVAGTWVAADPGDDFWYFPPDMLSERLFVPVETFRDRVAVAPGMIDRATWFLVADGRGISTANVAALSANAAAVVRQVETLLPGTRNSITPVDGFRGYQRAVAELTVLLAAFNVPIITLVLAFIVLITGLAVDQRRNEIAVLRSRGATPWQVVGFAVVEGLVLGLLALALGALLALALTHLMGRTQSFMDFSADYRLRVALSQAGVRAGLLAVGLALVAQVLPTLAASRETIISYKQEQARAVRRPWWQRAWLDVLLFLVALYGFYLLRQQGSLLAAGAAAVGVESGDPFQNPLLFVLPSLAIFSLALLFLRLFPWLMELFSWLLNRTDSVGLLLGGRQLARAPRSYAMPLILLVLTVSLAAFSASLARTLDLQLSDAMLYRTGADVQLIGAGVDFTPPGPFQEADAETAAGGLFLPLDEYRALPGVVAATRVGRYPALARVGEADVAGTYLGLDRAEFATAAFWRADFAADRLGALLNALAVTPDGLLVAAEFMAERGLAVGDLLRLNVTAPDGVVELDAQIAGALDYFPTWYAAEAGPLFVGNLDTLFAAAGGDMAYEVWLRTDAPPDAEALDMALLQRGLFGWRYDEPHTAIARELARPERQGLFGQLSVGFITAAALTVLGFFMYALFSFRQRLITLGILRAMGLSSGQMAVLVAFELGVLILSGLTLGTVLGVWISRLFIPYLQIGQATADLVPPYLVEIAWPAVFQIYGLFVLLFLAAVAVLTWLLRRMRLFQAIKLGETA